MWKNTVVLYRPQMTIRRMRIACWIPKAINTHSEYVILIAFPLQQWISERTSLFTFILTLPELYVVQMTFIFRRVKQGKCFKTSVSLQDGQSKQRKGVQRQTATRNFQLQRLDAGSTDADLVLPPNQPSPQVCSLSVKLISHVCQRTVRPQVVRMVGLAVAWKGSHRYLTAVTQAQFQ